MEVQDSNLGGTGLKKKMVPEAMSAMIWGIASIAAMAAFGFIASFVAFSKRKKALRAYEENPTMYNEKSLNLIRTAKTCGTIGLFASIAFTIFWILYIAFIVYIISMANSYSNSYYY